MKTEELPSDQHCAVMQRATISASNLGCAAAVAVMPVAAPAHVTVLSASKPLMELAEMNATAGKPDWITSRPSFGALKACGHYISIMP